MTTPHSPDTPAPNNLRDVRWRPAGPDLPEAVRPWLLDEGSLTQRLLDAGDGDFRVEVLTHGWGQATADERAALPLPPRTATLIREVLLRCGGEPWVYARSVLPAATLTGPRRHLRRLGAESLGALLFASPDMQRDPFEVARFPASALRDALPWLPDAWLWGRRSRFFLGGRPLLVTEIFLPAFRPDATSWT